MLQLQDVGLDNKACQEVYTQGRHLALTSKTGVQGLQRPRARAAGLPCCSCRMWA